MTRARVGIVAAGIAALALAGIATDARAQPVQITIAQPAEVYSKYILTDMFAKGVQGMKAEDAVKWAAGELRKIYG